MKIEYSFIYIRKRKYAGALCDSFEADELRTSTINIIYVHIIMIFIF